MAFQKLPVEVLLSCELLEERHQVYLHNFPKTFPITGDIWQLKDVIVEKTKELLGVHVEKIDVTVIIHPKTTNQP